MVLHRTLLAVAVLLSLSLTPAAAEGATGGVVLQLEEGDGEKPAAPDYWIPICPAQLTTTLEVGQGPPCLSRVDSDYRQSLIAQGEYLQKMANQIQADAIEPNVESIENAIRAMLDNLPAFIECMQDIDNETVLFGSNSYYIICYDEYVDTFCGYIYVTIMLYGFPLLTAGVDCRQLIDWFSPMGPPLCIPITVTLNLVQIVNPDCAQRLAQILLRSLPLVCDTFSSLNCAESNEIKDLLECNPDLDARPVPMEDLMEYCKRIPQSIAFPNPDEVIRSIPKP